MGELKEFIQSVHQKTKRSYIERAVREDRAECMDIASKFDKDYWDGQRHHGYGGYSYDGRWESVAQRMIDAYQLNNESKILDIGCGKGYLLLELKKLLPKCTIAGLDISKYAIQESHPEVKDFLICGTAQKLPFKDDSFDLIVSNMTLHNLTIDQLFDSLKEIERVSKKNSWLCVESFRNHDEKINMINWQLTCKSFYSPDEWKWIFQKSNYSGDYEFAYFE